MVARLLPGVAVALAALLALSGCSVPGSGPQADDAATHLAQQLSSGKLTAAVFTDSARSRASYATLTKGLGGLEPRVTVEATTDHDNNANAKLGWSWPVAGKTWQYSTNAHLTKRGDRWLAAWDPAMVEPSLEPGEVLATSTVKARRGDIVGAGGTHLVTPRPVIRFGIDKTKVPPAQAAGAARRLAGLLAISVAPYAKRVHDAGPKAFVEAIVMRRGEVPASVMNGYPKITGAVGISDHLPLAPTKEFAAGLLGTVGPATAEAVKAGKGRIKAGDDVGLSGLEKRYDEQLGGTSGVVIVAVSEKGARRHLFEVKPKDGKPLTVTLDQRLQRVAQDSLAAVRPASALVAIRPSTGDIVAAASGPGSHGYDTATYGRYAPGSTFKIVSSLALLRAGLTPRSTVHCTPTVDVSGKTFKNYSDYPSDGMGEISLTDALANSCNTAFISSHGRLHGDDLAQAAAALGFGVDHDLGFPAYFGQVPAPSGETEAAADMIGQGKVLASPMSMAAVVASVVKGAAVLPRLVPAYDVEQHAPAKPLTSAEARQLHAMMRAVVERGSGIGLADLPGPPAIAKTGTAEFGDKPPLPTHAWMVGAQGDLAVAVFVGLGDSGSHTAGPILESFLRQAR